MSGKDGTNSDDSGELFEFDDENSINELLSDDDTFLEEETSDEFPLLPADDNDELPSMDDDNSELPSMDDDDSELPSMGDDDSELPSMGDDDSELPSMDDEDSDDFSDEEEITEDDQTVELQDIYEEDSEEVQETTEEKVDLSDGPNPVKENYEDLKKFVKNISHGKVAREGNPPYSIQVTGIKYEDDMNDILSLLNEYGLLSPEYAETIKEGLTKGHLLLSHISEYAAIILAHKFRKFDLDIRVGLSEEIHPSKYYSNDATGMVTKENFRNSVSKSELISKNIRSKDVITTTTPTIENHSILKYIGIIFEEIHIKPEEVFETNEDLDKIDKELLNDPIVAPLIKKIKELEEHFKNDTPISSSFAEKYRNITEKLKQNAIEKGGNGIVGITYQLTHIEDKRENRVKMYKLVCSGSVVIIGKDS